VDLFVPSKFVDYLGESSSFCCLVSSIRALNVRGMETLQTDIIQPACQVTVQLLIVLPVRRVDLVGFTYRMWRRRNRTIMSTFTSHECHTLTKCSDNPPRVSMLHCMESEMTDFQTKYCGSSHSALYPGRLSSYKTFRRLYFPPDTDLLPRPGTHSYSSSSVTITRRARRRAACTLMASWLSIPLLSTTEVIILSFSETFPEILFANEAIR
jgi:hypothetical protein